jgi:hypothetical protein
LSFVRGRGPVDWEVGSLVRDLHAAETLAMSVASQGRNSYVEEGDL